MHKAVYAGLPWYAKSSHYAESPVWCLPKVRQPNADMLCALKNNMFKINIAENYNTYFKQAYCRGTYFRAQGPAWKEGRGHHFLFRYLFLFCCYCLKATRINAFTWPTLASADVEFSGVRLIHVWIIILTLIQTDIYFPQILWGSLISVHAWTRAKSQKCLTGFTLCLTNLQTRTEFTKLRQLEMHTWWAWLIMYCWCSVKKQLCPSYRSNSPDVCANDFCLQQAVTNLVTDQKDDHAARIARFAIAALNVCPPHDWSKCASLQHCSCFP